MQKLKQLLRYPRAEIGIIILATFTRFSRLWEPKTYIFDEVYHAFTAQQMAKGNPAAWEWWNTPPPGVAYEWTHPPIAKEFMWLAIRIFGDNSFAWRFFSAVFGVGIIILIYYLALKLFKNRTIALLASFTASLDGLLLVMSRIAMNDAYIVFFSLLGLLCFLYNRKLLAGIFIGLAVASKWTGVFGIGIVGILFLAKIIQLFQQKQLRPKTFIKEVLWMFVCFFILPLAMYIGSYLPFFMGNHINPGDSTIATTKFEQIFIFDKSHHSNWETFIKLQEQMWWYHTGLKAHHDYQSQPWQWMLDLRPVWFYVNYQPSTIANIYAFGNPIFMWFGLIAIAYVAWDFIKKRTLALATILLGYFGYFLPWVGSPRIMFYYHYTPSVPFIALAVGYTLYEFLEDRSSKIFVYCFIAATILAFLYFFPNWTGILIPKWWYNSYFWFPSWK